MDEISIKILNKVGIIFQDISCINGILITRDNLLCHEKYNELQEDIYKLKKILSSSIFTSLQKNAKKEQKWPLLNLVRQILHYYKFIMEPIRKSDGYTLDGVKKYKRYFLIKNM